MAYCSIHNCNNCVECALEKQTQRLEEAIRSLQPKPSKPWWRRLVSMFRRDDIGGGS